MTIHLSCGHVAEDGCLGVPVDFHDEQCVAGEGFVPCTVEAVYCHKCAMDLAAAEERAKIVAWLRKLSGYDSTTPTFQDRRLAHQLAALEFSNAIEAKEHLK